MLYDSSTHTVSATSVLNRPRIEHTATLLPAGQVLITGSITQIQESLRSGCPLEITHRLSPELLWVRQTAAAAGSFHIPIVATPLQSYEFEISGGGMS